LICVRLVARLTMVLPPLYSVENAVVDVAFHPLSDDHLVVLSLDGLRLFNVSEAR
jgi:hypothetical protein